MPIALNYVVNTQYLESPNGVRVYYRDANLRDDDLLGIDIGNIVRIKSNGDWSRRYVSVWIRDRTKRDLVVEDRLTTDPLIQTLIVRLNQRDARQPKRPAAYVERLDELRTIAYDTAVENDTGDGKYRDDINNMFVRLDLSITEYKYNDSGFYDFVLFQGITATVVEVLRYIGFPNGEVTEEQVRDYIKTGEL